MPRHEASATTGSSRPSEPKRRPCDSASVLGHGPYHDLDLARFSTFSAGGAELEDRRGARRRRRTRNGGGERLEYCGLQNFRTRYVNRAGDGRLEEGGGRGNESGHVVEVVIVPNAEDPGGIRWVGIGQRRQREQQRGEEKERELRPPRAPHWSLRYAARVPMSTYQAPAQFIGSFDTARELRTPTDLAKWSKPRHPDATTTADILVERGRASASRSRVSVRATGMTGA